MKKIIIPIIAVAAFATALVSCQKQELVVPDTQQEVTLTFASEKPAFDDETKTEWNGETIQWSEGDKIAIAYTCNEKWMGQKNEETQELSAPKLYKSDPLAIETETAKFNVSASFNIQNEGTHVFYGVYPAPSSTSFADAPTASLTVPALQTPKANSFDGAADLMTGVSVDAFNSLGEAKAENISMKWTRLVSHANITLKALNGVTAGERVSSITLTAQEGANLVGQQKVNLLTNEVANDNAASNVLELNGGNLSIDANGNVEFWACVLPETLTSLIVVVETDKATYTREITGISTTFMQNARNTLSINMDSANRVAKDVVSWVLVTSEEELTEGTYVLVVKNTNTKNLTGALDSSNGSSAAPALNTSVQVNDNLLTGVGSSVQFDMTIVEGGYKFAVSGQTTNYLYTTNSNNGVRIGTNTNNIWTLTPDSDYPDAYTFKCNQTERYMGVYETTPDWRCYTSINDNIGNRNSEIYLYKKVEGEVAPDMTPKIVVAETEQSIGAEGGELTFAYTLNNLGEEVVTVTVTSDFITAEATDGIVTVTVDANETTDERETTITLSCGDADDVILTVTQKGKVIVDSNFESGQYWIMGTEDDITRVMTPLGATVTYGYGQSEVVTDNRSFAKNAFTFTAVTGGYTIQDASGRYYYADATHKSFQLGTDSSADGLVWTVGVQNDGSYVLTNVASARTMKYGDGTYTTFGVYTETEEETGVYPTLVKADNPLPVELSSISVSGQKTSFTVGDDFEFGGTVTATYNDGSTKTVTPTSISSPDMEKAENQVITVTYTEGTITKTTSYTIYVTDPNAGGGGLVPSNSPCYTLDTSSNTGGSNGYATDSEITVDEITWVATGNTTMAPWRIGGKSLTNVDRNVYTKTAYTSPLSKVEFVAGSVGVTWNSLKLMYSTNADFSNAQTITATGIGANNTISFEPEEGFPSNCYYKFVINITVSDSSNKYMQLNKIVFYGYE